jgi:hypothetical protein
MEKLVKQTLKNPKRIKGYLNISDLLLDHLLPHRFFQPPGVDFTNMFKSSFYAYSSQKHKDSVKLSVSFYALGIYEHISCA